MKSVLMVPALVMLLLLAGPARAADYRFETTAEGMVKQLQQPGSRSGKPVLRTRGLSRSAGKKRLQLRGLTVEEKPGTQAKVTSVTLPDQRVSNFINLAIHFDVNSYAVPPTSIPLLDELGKALNHLDLKQQFFHVNGHTDADGSDEYNLKLSLNRALSVRQYLVSNHAVASKRLKVMGYGEGLPLQPNTSARNKQLNRRVEIMASN